MEEQHWQNAQSIELGLDLISAARSQLRLLSAVDAVTPDLYRGPALQRAISRYENCWLPLLAEYGPYTGKGTPLMPPLDCAWVWHCHRLNPVQYLSDCNACYGKVLDAPNMPTDKGSEAVAYTKQLWDSQFPDEEYDCPPRDLSNYQAANAGQIGNIKYDLHAAVERQSSFFYQVARSHFEEEKFLQAALQRYKGFLYLLKLSGLRLFLVPTYDIDLMWHSHQASPGTYQKDTTKLLGRVLNHDDTDSDRTEGQKLDTGFNKTRDLWQCTFGSPYERAGAMYRGEAPALPRLLPGAASPMHLLECWSLMSLCQTVPVVEPRRTMQVFVNVHRARNLHFSQEAVVAVQLLFQKRCSRLKLETSWVKATQNPEWNGFWSFECEEATQGILLELQSQDLPCCSFIKKSMRLIGEAQIPWQTLLSSPTLSFDGWVPLLLKSQLEGDQKPTSLRVSISITPPVTAPVLLRMEHSSFRHRGKDCISRIVYDHKNEKKFVVKVSGEGAHETFQPSLVHVYSSGGKDSPVVLLGMANYIESATTTVSETNDVVHVGIASSSIQGYQPGLQMAAASGDSVIVLHGRNCQYEVHDSTQAEEVGFLTIVPKLAENSFGRATALLNWKSGAMEISGEQYVLTAILLCTIMASVTNTSYHKPPCKLKRPLWRRGRVHTDDWGAVILNRHSYYQIQDDLQFGSWYKLSSNLWMSVFYNAGLGCLRNWAHSLRKLSLGSRTCDGGNCGGCGAGACGNSYKSNASVQRGGGCGGCGSGGCGGCGASGFVNNMQSDVSGRHGSGCGGCGAGGCMNGLESGGNPLLGKEKLKHLATQGGGGCGGCGAGGCGNSLSFTLLTPGGGCGGCGAGGCGNSIKNTGGKAVQGGKCGGCGAGGCGNSIVNASGKGIQGAK